MFCLASPRAAAADAANVNAAVSSPNFNARGAGDGVLVVGWLAVARAFGHGPLSESVSGAQGLPSTADTRLLDLDLLDFLDVLDRLALLEVPHRAHGPSSEFESIIEAEQHWATQAAGLAVLVGMRA